MRRVNACQRDCSSWHQHCRRGREHPRPALKPAARVSKEPWDRMANILVVEDNDDVREMMAVTLELEGHEVATACNGRDALNKLRTGEMPRLILLDLMMPVMNGWEFCRALDQDPVLKRVPVVVVSAATAELTERTEAAVYLPKPIDMDELLHVVHDFCGNGTRISS